VNVRGGLEVKVGSTTQVLIPMRLSVDVQTPDYPTQVAKHSPTRSFTYKFIPLRVHTPKSSYTYYRFNVTS